MHFENKVSKDLGKKFKTPDYSSLVKYLIDNDYYTENEKDIESNAIFAIQQKAILDYGKEYLPKMGPLTEESWKRIGEKYRKRFEEEGD